MQFLLMIKKNCEEFSKINFEVRKEYDENDKDTIVELKLGGTFNDSKIKYKEVEKKIPLFFQ